MGRRYFQNFLSETDSQQTPCSRLRTPSYRSMASTQTMRSCLGFSLRSAVGTNQRDYSTDSAPF
jgi:hypothetical protein